MPDDTKPPESIADRFRRAIDKSATFVATARDTAVDVYDGTGLRDAVARASDAVGEQAQRLDEHTGLVSTARVVVDAASDTIDRVTGKAIFDAVEAFLAEQSRFNDLLATKLDEALRRIEALEANRTEE